MQWDDDSSGFRLAYHYDVYLFTLQLFHMTMEAQKIFKFNSFKLGVWNQLIIKQTGQTGIFVLLKNVRLLSYSPCDY